MASHAALRHLLSCSLPLPLGFNPWQKHSFSVKQQEVGSKGANSQQGLLRTPAHGTETKEINIASVLEKKLQEEPARPREGGHKEHRASSLGLVRPDKQFVFEKLNWLLISVCYADDPGPF